MDVAKSMDLGMLYVSEEGAFYLTKQQIGLLREVRDANRLGKVYGEEREGKGLAALAGKRAVEYVDHPLLGVGWMITEHGKNILRNSCAWSVRFHSRGG